MRLLIKHTIAVLLYYSGLLRIWELFGISKRPKQTVTILTYHCFLNETDRLLDYLQPGLSITPDQFDQQLSFLKKHYHLLSLDDYTKLLDNNEMPPKRSVVITIDDGWRDNFDNAFPLLKKHEAPATVFLTTDYIETDNQFWFLRVGYLTKQADISLESLSKCLLPILGDRFEAFVEGVFDTNDRLGRDQLLEKLKSLDYNSQLAAVTALENEAKSNNSDFQALPRTTLTWAEIQKMSDGGVSFGSHGQTHQIMTLLSPTEAMVELEESKKIISAALGLEIKHFAYPNGNFSQELASAAKKTGYHAALATGQGSNPNDGELGRYSIRRIGMHNGVSLGINGHFSKAMFALHLTRVG